MQDNNTNGYMMPNLVNKKLQKEVLPAREFTLSEMLSKFTPEEALKIAYLPIVLTQAAFRFATAVADECAQRQLDYKKPVREIRTHTKEYIRNIIGGDKADLINSLENQVCAFLGKAGNDVQTLYFCINSELKKEYPHLTEYNLLTNIYICQALCTYVRAKEMHYDSLSECVCPLLTRAPSIRMPWLYARHSRRSLVTIRSPSTPGSSTRLLR